MSFFAGGKLEAGSFQWADGMQGGHTRSVDGAGENADSCVSWNVQEDSWISTSCGAKLAHICLICKCESEGTYYSSGANY